MVDGWFKKNLSEVEAFEHEQGGVAYLFGEARPLERYRDLGINIRVLEPGQPAGERVRSRLAADAQLHLNACVPQAANPLSCRPRVRVL